MALQLRRRACLSEVVGISWCNLLPVVGISWCNLLPIADKVVILDGWVYYACLPRQ